MPPVLRSSATVATAGCCPSNDGAAAPAIPPARHLGVDFDRLDVDGGATGVDHPFGPEVMCVGGGQGLGTITEGLS
ncbi:hypothetical protein [Streptomyces viridosporus]|uniref:hypothetical protein n=1 Tax=Streptomyces viridosporus TaxID=67581 RepID=UPI0036FE8384